MNKWTLFSNHGHVLLYLAQDLEARLRDIAQGVGITERAVQKIIRDLCDGDIVEVSRHGRRNRYRIHTRKPLRHTLASHRTIGQLLKLMSEDKKPAKRKTAVRKTTTVAPLPEPAAVVDEWPKPGPEPAPEPVPEPEPEKQDSIDAAKQAKKKNSPQDQQRSLF